MDDEELQRRYTDCVYFLASPLTCKKGMDCEYRHSEIARLNPRDCWYWLAGSCLNFSCAFRHPPLERHIPTVSEASETMHGSTLPAIKKNVPCYFYFSGFCNKGERCSFLHGHEDTSLPQEPAKEALAVSNAVPLEKKLSIGSSTGSLPTVVSQKSEIPLIRLTETQPNDPDKDIIRLASNTKRSFSPLISASRCGESAVVGSASLTPEERFVQGRSSASTDHCLEEPVGKSETLGYDVDQKQWLESLPGFDVQLMMNKSEKIAYEDDKYNLPVVGEEGTWYDYGVFNGYDPASFESDCTYEQEQYVSHVDLNDEENCDYVTEVSRRDRGSIFLRLSAPKRKFFSMSTKFDGRRSVDLRDRLKKRRIFCDDSQNHSSNSNNPIGRIRGTARWRLTGDESEGRFPRMPRQHFKGKRHPKKQFMSSETSMKWAQKKRYVLKSSIFTGPKSLDQLKEEKKKAPESGDISGNVGKTASHDFRGPKPLEDILRDKRRLCSVAERSS